MSNNNTRTDDLMTSLAVFPPLKRSITDMMDEELYQLPNSPVQVSSNTSTNNGNSTVATNLHYQKLFPNNTDSLKLAGSRNVTMNSGSPSFNNTQMFSHSNTSNSSTLSSFLNVEESFLDQFRTSGANDETSYAAFFDDDLDMDREDVTRINPFTDYGNPDSTWNNQFNNNNKYNQQYQFQVEEMPVIPDNQYNSIAALPQQFPQRPNRRRRITILDDDDSTKKKDDDFMLYNPDIQPSHLVNNPANQNNLWNPTDEYLFVPPPQVKEETATIIDVNNTIIPGYENDYMLFADYDEEVEEELSEDDEDDEDNYFHVDDEFDELIMNNITTQENLNFMDMDNYLSPNMYKSVDEPHEEQVLELRNQMQDFQIRDERSVESAKESDDYSSAVSEDSESSQEQQQSSSSHPVHVSAAEISASNPDHHCDLVNPATGVPCNKQFSRPYDLVRHQETIHASKKKIFRCVICEGRMGGGPGNGKSKTFSRGDALSRHIKVKHGLGGKEALELINQAKENVEYIPVA